jgi:hypothetical protein
VVGPAIQVSVTSVDKVASGTLGIMLGRQSQGEWNPWLRLAGPIDESNSKPPVPIADLNGLRDARRVAIGLNFVRWRWSADDVVLQRRGLLCREVFKDTTDQSEAPDSIVNVLRTGVRTQADPSIRQRVFDSTLTYVVDHRCSKHRLPEQARILFDSMTDYGKIWFAGISGEYGQQIFRFADTVAVAFRKRSEEPWSVSLGAGVYLPLMRVQLATTVRLEHSIESGPSTQYCIPVGGTAALQCRTVALAPPQRGHPVLWTFEARYYVNGLIGIDPRVTVDLSGAQGVGLELPVLLRQADDKGFTSALILGWRSKPSSQDANDRVYVALQLGASHAVGLHL